MKITFTLEEMTEAFAAGCSTEKVAAAYEILTQVSCASFEEWQEIIDPYVSLIPASQFIPYSQITDTLENRQDVAFWICNELLEFYGEESVGRSDILSSYNAVDATFGQDLGTVAYRYLNAGDCYNATLIHDLVSDRLFISTVGDTEEHFDQVARLVEQLKQVKYEPDDTGYKVILIQKPETSIYSLVVGENVSPDYEGLAVYRWADDEAYQDLAIELLTDTFGDRLVGNHFALIS